jgi:hypothetical protein
VIESKSLLIGHVTTKANNWEQYFRDSIWVIHKALRPPAEQPTSALALSDSGTL